MPRLLRVCMLASPAVKHLNLGTHTWPQAMKLSTHTSRFITQVRPLTMQDIVYKLCHLGSRKTSTGGRETYAEKEYSAQGPPSRNRKGRELKKEDQTPDGTANADQLRFDEQVNLVLEPRADCKLKDQEKV